MKTELQFFFKKELGLQDKGIMKLIQGDKTTTLHYLNDGNKLKVLTLGYSEKVKRLAESTDAKLSFSNKSKEMVDVKVSIVNDKNAVKELFDTMLDMHFTHYKKYNAELVILEMTLQI